jgi:hypothetical protein
MTHTQVLKEEVTLLCEELMLSDDKVFAVERLMTASSLLRNLFRLLNGVGDVSQNTEIVGLVETLNVRAEDLLCGVTMSTDMRTRWDEHQKFCKRLGVAAAAVGSR